MLSDSIGAAEQVITRLYACFNISKDAFQWDLYNVWNTVEMAMVCTDNIISCSIGAHDKILGRSIYS